MGARVALVHAGVLRGGDVDLRNGKTYETREDALKDGVPDADIAEVTRAYRDVPEVRFANGPFKNRVYKRTPAGQLVRVGAMDEHGQRVRPRR